MTSGRQRRQAASAVRAWAAECAAKHAARCTGARLEGLGGALSEESLLRSCFSAWGQAWLRSTREWATDVQRATLEKLRAVASRHELVLVGVERHWASVEDVGVLAAVFKVPSSLIIS